LLIGIHGRKSERSDKPVSENISLVSSEQISLDELENLILRMGGFLTTDFGRFGQISPQKKAVIWLWLGTIQELFSGEPPELPQKIQAKLEGVPKTHIIIEISTQTGSQKLAVDFAAACAERWPCVVDPGHGIVFSREEILQIQREGGWLLNYGI
jgi:hypothetical protein